MNGVVTVSAHRGGRETAPSGTWQAYADALTAGADFVEVDVQRTRDGHLVAFHDGPLEAGGVRPPLLTRAQLDEGAGRDVPGYADLLRLVAGRARAQIDLKIFDPRIVPIATEILGDGNFVVTGGDAGVAEVKRRHPRVRTAVSLGQGWRDVPWRQTVSARRSELFPLERIRACGADAVAVHYRLARLGVLARCARENIGVMVWTVNSSALIQSLLRDRRVEMLITDRPGYALAVRHRLCQS